MPTKVISPEDGAKQDAPAAGSTQALTRSSSQAVCDCDQLLGALRAASCWLDHHVASVNAMNVFPVPDGDTGTNMSLTMRAALDELGDESYTSVSELTRVVARGALMGARGNSGVILSQILRGFARVLQGKDSFGGLDLAEALQQGAVTAYKGVMRPVEGTILTVARECAESASRAALAGDDVERVLAGAVAEAQASLARTPSLLPVLAEAGVVDAGAQGYVLILEGMLRQMRGQPVVGVAPAQVQPEHVFAPQGEYNYDTQFVIKGDNLDVETIRQQIATMGDSVLVVGDDRVVKVHVHCDHPGRVLDYGIERGDITSVIVENMQLQYQEFVASSQPPAERPLPLTAFRPPAPKAEPLSDICVVAVASGEGLTRVFESLGASGIVPGGQTMNPSTQDLLTCIESVASDQVIVLPNNSNIILAAQQAMELSEKQVTLVPTESMPQGIAALLAFNYQAGLEANAELMLEAARQVETAEVTRAVRSATINGLSIAEGQVIGLLNGDLVVADEDVLSVAKELLERTHVEDYEIVTVYYGEDVSLHEATELAEYARQAYPDLEVELLDGGQPHYFYVISAE